MKRFLKILGIVIAVLIIILIALPFFIDANVFRPKLESELTDALGRQVSVGNLSLSIFTGSVAADNISIADDPKFSNTPFVQAKSLKVGVELIPLTFSKTLNVTNLTLNEPQISLVKSEDGQTWNFSSLGNKNASAPTPAPAAETTANTSEEKKASGSAGAPKSAPAAKSAAAPNPAPATPPAESSSSSSPASSNPNLSVKKLKVNNGQLTVSRADSTEPQRVYRKVNIEVKNFSFTTASPFQMSADLPSVGTMKLSGGAGPIDLTNAARTPFHAKISVQKMNLASSGFIDPAAGIGGNADLDGNIVSDGHQAKADGTVVVNGLKVAAKGSPAGRPVDVKFGVVDDLVKQSGEISQCDISMGKAVAHLTGTFDTAGKVTVVHLKLDGPNMPVDDLEAMLPALGVTLPPQATLKGGVLNVTADTSGAVNELVTVANVKLENTQLANFNLGQKLGGAVSALGGKNTGNDTTIQNFNSDVKVAPQGTQASNINLTVPAIGVLTGDGTVSPSDQLAFKMKAEVGGLGIPFGVTGTSTDPKFTPDVKGMASGLLQGALSSASGGNKNQQQNPINNVMGLFKKKQ